MSSSKKAKLDLSDSSDDEESGGIKVNSSYAESYNRFREKEILQKLKDRYKGQENHDEDESSSSSSSSEEEEDNPEFDQAFFKTLSLLKEKNSKIYDGKTSFFQNVNTKAKSKPKAKTMTLRDLERNVMLEKEGKFDEIPHVSSEKGYYEELDDIKSSFKTANKDSDEDDDDLLQAKSKTPQEVQKEEDEYKLWLAGQKDSLQSSEEAQNLKGLKEFWGREDLDSSEKFLRDYILKEKYKENNAEDVDSDDETENRIHDSDENLSEDEKTVEKMEEFETKFNFRFEEPDAEFIKRYPRTIEDSMRKKDDSRKRKREETKLKKEQEKNKKIEELKQLKSLKRKEILEKIKKIQNVAGSEEVDFNEGDLEGDFDPDSYDKRMEEIFKNYDDDVMDDEKPVFPDLEDSDIEEDLEVDNWDEWTPQNPDENDQEDEDMEIDNEGDEKETFQKEVLSTLGKRKGKRKSKFAEIMEKKRPTFDPETNKTFEKYLDEYYKLDFEDVIGDMPCRFKYRSVPKNSFGLEVEEILSAPDRELNAWSSLKKTCQYRDERDEKADIVSYKNKGTNFKLKQKILPSLFTSNPEEELEAERQKKSKKSKRNRKKQSHDDEEEAYDHSTEATTSAESKSSSSEKIHSESAKCDSNNATQNANDVPNKSRKRKRNKNFDKKTGLVNNKKKININAEIQMSDQRLEAYGLAPGKFKRKIRQKKFN